MPSITADDDGVGFALRATSGSGAGIVAESEHGPAVSARSTFAPGIHSFSEQDTALIAESKQGAGVVAASMDSSAIIADANGPQPAILAKNSAGAGLMATSQGANAVEAYADTGTGISVTAPLGTAIVAESHESLAIVARSGAAGAIECTSDSNAPTLHAENSRVAGTGVHAFGGVRGIGVSGVVKVGGGTGVHGQAHDSGVGVWGASNSGFGVHGESREGTAVRGVSEIGSGIEGRSDSGVGVDGRSADGPGVRGASKSGEGVHGETRSKKYAGVGAIQLDPASGAPALYAEHKGEGTAAFLSGNLVLTGHIQFLGGGDVAEGFELAQGLDAGDAPPGMVMSLASDGQVRPSHAPYDTRVAGVVAGAVGQPIAMVLGEPCNRQRVPIALVGRVLCHVSADWGPICVGDFLTTAPAIGTAMKATDRVRAFGSTLGKALAPLERGSALLPVLVTLR